MILAIRRSLQDRRRHAVILALIAVLGTSLWAAHAAPAQHHMGKAVAMCLAVAAVATAAVAAAPVLGRLLPERPRAPRSVTTRPPSAAVAPPLLGRARGHPAVLQVFRL